MARDRSAFARSGAGMARRTDRTCALSSDLGDTPGSTTRSLPICDSIASTDVVGGTDVTLRARLTAAFLAVVLGPVLLGAVFVGIAVAAVSDQRVSERLESGAENLRAALAVTCQRLRLGAETAALLGDRPAPAPLAIRRGLAPAVE